MKRLALLSLVAAAAACNQTEFEPIREDAQEVSGSGIGGDGWRDDDISCEQNSDCQPGEQCGDGICQLARCGEEDDMASDAPMGNYAVLLRDKEMLVADGDASDGGFWVDGYALEAGSVSYPGSWNAGSAAIVDVAGGNVLGSAPEHFVVANEGRSFLSVPEAGVSVDVGGQPAAIATGDLDNDGTDEVAVVLQGGGLAICELSEPTGCELQDAAHGDPADVAIAELDGDDSPEVVVLLEVGGQHVLEVWTPAAEADAPRRQAVLEEGADRIASVDLDGDGKDEIAAFADDDWGFWAHASLRAFSLAGDEAMEVAFHEIHDSTVDIAVDDLDDDGKDEILALRSNAEIELLVGTEGGFESAYSTSLTVSRSPKRLGVADIDGDSIGGRLVEGPKLVTGPVIPTVVLEIPPYDAERSEGLPSLTVGRSETVGESLSDTVSLSLSVDVGVSADFFGVFEAGLSGRVSQTISRTHAEASRLTVGDRFSVTPDPDRADQSYGAVVVAAGCFHAYTYEVDDPNDAMGADGEEMVILVPVGGSTGLWSTTRYNAMAKALGTLPEIEIESSVGNPASYAAEPSKLDGSEIDEEDLVFTDVPELVVSDIGDVGYFLSAEESTTTTTASTVNVDVTASLGLGPFQFGATVGQGRGQAYSLTVGSNALFLGSVPPVPDVPETPEDEHADHAYAFSPVVYREHYDRGDGQDAGYFVVSHVVH